MVLGRLAVQAANLLRGKHKPTFAPHVDGGDFVVIINADKVAITGNKRTDKFLYHHSGYPGGLKSRSVGEVLDKNPGSPRGEGRHRHAPEEQAGPRHRQAS